MSECPEERVLRDRYYAAVKAYGEKITALASVSTNEEFENAYELAEGARLQFVNARFHLRYHIQKHSCVALEESARAS